MAVKIIQDELLTQINVQLKTVVEDAVKNHIENINWSLELDIYNLIQDELNNMDILDHLDTSDLENTIGEKLESMLSELTIQRGA